MMLQRGLAIFLGCSILHLLHLFCSQIRGTVSKQFGNDLCLMQYEITPAADENSIPSESLHNKLGGPLPKTGHIFSISVTLPANIEARLVHMSVRRLIMLLRQKAI